MPETVQKTEEDHLARTRCRLLDAALAHVPFDGWSDATFRGALADSGLDEALARLACPRGALDLAIEYHRRGDRAMVARAGREDMSSMRYGQRVAALVRWRIEAIDDREVLRRSMTFFSMPQHAAEGARLIWGTADLIWNTLGDSSRDLNWYTKRATLSAVYSSTLLFWLGDDSPDHEASWAFLDRRIHDVLQIEKFKGKARANPLFQGLMRGPGKLLDRIHAPDAHPREDLPGYVKPAPQENHEDDGA